MENDGPVSAVQVRLAKGEISTAQYKEIMTNLMKNVSSFQQTSSLKIIQMRYAKSEITSVQYQENYTNLMKNLYSQPWSPALHILHIRYAEGELDTSQYEEMFANLTQEQFSYDQSTPLWILNNRYAKGDLTTSEYEEILSLFSDYTLSLQQSAMKMPGELQASFNSQEKKGTSPVSKKSDSSHHADRSSLNLKTASVPLPVASDTMAVPQGDSDLNGYDHADEKPVRSSPSVIATDQLPDQTSSDLLEIQTDVSSDTGNDGAVQSADKDGLEFGETGDSLSEPVSDSTSEPETETAGKSSMSPDLMSIPELKTGTAVTSEIHNFPSTLSQAASTGTEALPSDFLSLGIKQGTGAMAGSDDMAMSGSANQVHADYSIADTSSGNKSNTYDTVTSKITSPADSSGLMEIIPEDSLEDTRQSEEKAPAESSDIRQKIKTLIVKGDYQEAVDLAETMIGADDNDYLPHFYKGMARYYLNIHEEALVDLDHARELCKNKDEIRKIDTIRNHILVKQRKDADAGEIEIPEKEKIVTEEPALEQTAHASEGNEDISVKLDALGKKAQNLIDKKDYKAANTVLTEFIDSCAGLSKERLLAESVDEIYAAMGFVRYQLKDYSHAKHCFQEALAINVENEVANNYMKDILIRAARKK